MPECATISSVATPDPCPHRIAAQFAVTRILAEAPTLREAAPRLLAAVCTEMSWECGAIWSVESEGDQLHCVDAQARPGLALEPFLAETASKRFERGVGLPGRVMATGKPAWITDVTVDDNFPRRHAADAVGLRTAFGFPIAVEGTVIGVIEFFCREVREADDGLLAMMDDIGRQIGQFVARRRAEDALRRQTTLYGALLQAQSDLGDGIALCKGDRVVYANEAMGRILGYTPEELRMLPSFFVFALPEDLARLRAMHARRMAGDPRDDHLAISVRHRSGRRVDLDLAMKSYGSDFSEFVAIVRDVTERKALEARLIRADRMASLGTLAAGVAHEINNPLTYVLLHLGYLARELPKLGAALRGNDDAERRLDDLGRRIAETLDGVERVELIVRDLKLFSRPEAERREPVDVRRVIDSAANMAASEIRHRARLRKEYMHVRPILATEARLGQLFLNLLVNAAQAIPEGEADKNEISISVHEKGERVVVEVRDTGCGIPPEVQARIFDPFFTTKPVGVGTGLGLSICHGIVESLGGEIRVESRPGAGSKFTVLLPAAQAGAVDSAAPL